MVAAVVAGGHCLGRDAKKRLLHFMVKNRNTGRIISKAVVANLPDFLDAYYGDHLPMPALLCGYS